MKRLFIVLMLFWVSARLFAIEVRANPNPINNTGDMQIYIDGTYDAGSTAVYKIFDLNRRLVITLNAPSSSAQLQVLWTESERRKVRSGVYIVHVVVKQPNNGEKKAKLRLGYVKVN